jgi:TolA-binding protein
VPVSYASASGTYPTFALASYTTTAVPSPTLDEVAPDAVTTEAREVVAAAEASVTAAAAVSSDIAASGLPVNAPTTTVDTTELVEAADRLELGIGHLPEVMLPDVAEDVSELATSVDEQVASLRGSLDAAIALKAQQEAEEKARREAEEKARLEAEEKARQQAAAAAAAAAAPKTTTPAPARSTPAPSVPIPSGNGNGDNSPAGAQAYAASRLGAHGWGSDQFGCLVSLWNRESGWNYQAYNRSSGAFGIPQALPGSKMGSAGADWQTNAATQVNWGLGYIAGRYGSPCGAWGHSQSTGWY